MAASDGLIEIGTSVDISGLQSGMAEAQQAVTASTSQMTAAYERLAGATAQYGVSTANLRAVIGQLVSGQVPYVLATKALVEPLQEQTAASKALAAAKIGLAQAEAEGATASLVNASATEANAAAQRGLMSSTMQARLGAQLLGRELGARMPLALSTVASKSALLGPILESAFPIITAAGFATILIDVGKNVYDVYENYISLNGEAEKFAKTVREGIVKDFIDVHSLEDARDRLDQATVSATALGEAARNIHSISFKDLMGGVMSANIGTIASGAAGMATSHAGQAEANVKQGQSIALQVKQVDLTHQLRMANLEAASAAGEHLRGQEKITAELRHQLAVHAEERRYNNERDRAMGNPVAKDSGAELEGAQDKASYARAGSQSSVQAEEDARKAITAKKQAEEQAIQGDRQYLDSMKSLQSMTAVQEAQYWESVSSTATYGSKLYVTAVDEANKAFGHAQQENQQASARMGDEMMENWTAANRAADEAKKKQEELANAVGAAADRMTAAEQKAAESVQEASLHANEAAGHITKLGAAEEQARIHAQAYREELARLDSEITRVSSDAALTPQQRTQQVGQLQSQKTQVQGQAQTSQINDQAAINQQIAQPFTNAFDQINQGWMQVQNKMLFSTRNIGVEFAKMGQQLVVSAVDSSEKWALQWIEKQLLTAAVNRMVSQQKVVTTDVANAQVAVSDQTASNSSIMGMLLSLIFHKSIQAQKVTTTAAANAAATAATLSSNIVSAQSYAAVAAVAAMASAAAIPVVGWVIAPEAGAGIYAAASGFAAMAALDSGTGFVPKDGIAVLHQGEIVVPAPTADELRGSDGGSGVTVNQHNNWNTMGDRDFQRQLQRHASHVAAAVQKHMRQGGRG